MHAHRVDVLHGTDRHNVSETIAHDLELDFLPTGNAALHQNLRDGRQTQTILRDLFQLFTVLANAAAAAAQRVGGTHDHRIADLLRKGQRIGNVLHHLAGDAGLTDGLHSLLEF